MPIYNTSPAEIKPSRQEERAYSKKTLDLLDKLLLKGKDLDNTAEKIGKSFGSAFEKAIYKGQDFNSVLQGLEKQLQYIVFNSFVTKPLENFMKEKVISGMETIFTGSGSSSIFTKFMNYFSPVAKSSTDDVFDLELQFGDALPKRTTGGSTSADKAPTVGKNRSDNFNPGSAGDSNPNVTVHMTINTPDAQSFRANQGEILAELNRAMLRGQRNM